jgi:hypothetical protein
VHSCYLKLKYLLALSLTFILLTAFSSLDYTRKVDPLPNMPKGNPDPNVGIVIRSNSSGTDVVGDSGQSVRFLGIKNYGDTHIERLSSSSIFDKTPKKIAFIDEKHGFSSDRIFEFSMMFSDKNHQWKYVRFMPFNSVVEWVTEDKLRAYLDNWVDVFENAGWKRVEHPKNDDPRYLQNFSLPTPKYNSYHQYCSWKTEEYEAVITVELRDPSDYKYYVPKAERKNIKTIPNGYIAFIELFKKSQFSDYSK